VSLWRSQNAGQTGQNDCARPNSLHSLVLVSRGRSNPTDSTYDWREIGVQASCHIVLRKN
jgi:hypothetical protein